MLHIPVGNLLKEPQGAKEHIEIDDFFDMPKETGIRLLGPAKGSAILMNMENSIYTEIIDVHIPTEGICDLCLSTFENEIVIGEVDREYYLDKAAAKEATTATPLLIDKTKQLVNLEPMLAEEIVLHFPPIPVCSDGCLGLCVQCGKNLNQGPCSH